MDKLKVFTAFSGYDSQCLGLERLKDYCPEFDYELVGWSEIDKYAILGHNALFPQYADRNYGDISKVDWKNVPDFDLFTYSSPCFKPGTLVLTKKGYKNIEDVNKGDYVLTHTNEFRSVLDVMVSEYNRMIFEISGILCDRIECTDNHPFYVKKQKDSVPEWIEARDLKLGNYLGYAISQEQKMPFWSGTPEFRKKMESVDFWFVMGVYAGGGIADDDIESMHMLEEAVKNCGINHYIDDDGNINVDDWELSKFVDRYNNGSIIEDTIINLPVNLIASFIKGFRHSSGDLTYKPNAFVYGFQQCVAKVCGCNSEIFFTEQGEVLWSEQFDDNGTFMEDGIIWFPIRDINTYDYEGCVYNLEVDIDHSYTANGAIVHNCQDWSTAGLQAGGAEGSGTRSSLLWECKRTIEEKRPKYCILENVVALTHKKYFPYFEKWMNLVNSFGYKSYYKILNASDYGIAQNRPRVFLVSVRNDVASEFYFPDPITDRPHLYEYLQPDSEIDPKYYRTPQRLAHYLELNDKAIKKLEVPENAVAGYDVLPCGLYCHSSDPFNAPPLYDLSRCLKSESIESGIIYKKDGKWNERLFTQLECFRLMGLKDDEYEKLAEVVTPHQQSKMAGNSIVVDVLFHIFRKLLVDKEPSKYSTIPLF